MKTIICLFLALLPGLLSAQSSPVQWHHLDPKTDNIMGISTQRAYRELLRGLKPMPVIVAVIDDGIDAMHNDLSSALWTNPMEVTGNGKDDDNNGYVDDIRGWNFLGGKDGVNLEFDQKEETRLVARLGPLYQNADRASLPVAQHAEYDLYMLAKREYDTRKEEKTALIERLIRMHTQRQILIPELKKAFGVTRLDSALLHYPPTNDSVLREKALLIYRQMAGRGESDADKSLANLKEGIRLQRNKLDYGYNLSYDPRSPVGDHPGVLAESGYGNADITGPDASHGTHVAGIIAARHTNQTGVMGVADHAYILCIRTVPNGDERDKDVANAIRYAADQGGQNYQHELW